MPVLSDAVTAAEGTGEVVDAPWPDADVAATRDLLARHGDATALVYLSSAAVYGGWPDNPVPLTEDAPLRPNDDDPDGVAHAEAERLVGEWADDHPDARVAILRAATVVGPGIGGPSPRTRGPGDEQFVHVDDVAAAVRLAARHALDGVFNVAADGSIPRETVRRLGTARFFRDTRPRPIVANDKLRAAGWRPQYSNEEAVVSGSRGSWWREMSPGRRQQLTLAASVAVLLAALGGVVAVVLRRRRGAA